MLLAFRSQLSATEHGWGIKHSRRKAKTPRGAQVEWRVFRARWCELRLKTHDYYGYYGFLTLKSAIIHNLSENSPRANVSLEDTFPGGARFGLRWSFRTRSLIVGRGS